MSLGYHDCPCRDCFEIAIGGTVKRPHLCNACEEAGCSAAGDEECQAPDAYGGEPDPDPGNGDAFDRDF